MSVARLASRFASHQRADQLSPHAQSFLAGKPNPSTFPFEALEIKLKPVIPGGKVETLTLDGTALETGLQYQATAGLGGLVKWLTELTEKRHLRKDDGNWRVSVGAGSQDLLHKVRLHTVPKVLCASGAGRASLRSCKSGAGLRAHRCRPPYERPGCLDTSMQACESVNGG